MSGTSFIEVTHVGLVGIIELALPQKLNSLSIGAYQAIEAALGDFERADSGVRVVLIRAQGKHFCVGADLNEAKLLRNDSEKIAQFIHYGHHVLKRLENSDLPIVVACQGLALAGGGELILACDVVFAANDFRFGDQHAQYGLIPGWGGTQRLARLIGLRRSLDLFFSAKWVDAQTALQWGLVNYVIEADKLTETALEYCTKLATRSRNGIAAMKTLARQGLDLPLEDGLTLEEGVATKLMLSDDVTEGLAAFEARRTPVFSN